MEKLIVLQVSRKDQFERKNGGAFDADEFNEFPERYISNFAHKFAPYSSVIVNGNFFKFVYYSEYIYIYNFGGNN